MKVGAVVSPMNPTFREREVKNQVNDAESKILLVQNDLFPVVEKRPLPDLPTLEKVIVTRGPGKEGRRFFALMDLLKKLSRSLLSPLPRLSPKEDLAALPYSSGTAGLSKGVMITHFNLVANTLQSMNAVEAREDDVFISFLPFNHIYGFTYFLCGSIYLGASQVSHGPLQCRRLSAPHGKIPGHRDLRRPAGPSGFSQPSQSGSNITSLLCGTSGSALPPWPQPSPG